MKQTRRWLCLGAFALVVAGGGRWWLVTHPSAPIITYTPAGDLADGVPIPFQTRRPGHLATVIRGRPRDAVRLDDRAFDAGGRVTDLNLSADGQHVSWVAGDQVTSRAYVDGRPGQTRAKDAPCFLPNGGWAYVYDVGSRQRLLINEQPHGLFDRIEPFDAQSQNVEHDYADRDGAEPARSGRPRFWIGANGRLRWLLTSDQRFGPYDRIDDVHLSPDNRHWACVVREGSHETLLRDGQPLSWHDAVLSPSQPTGDDCCCGEGSGPFTADGQHVVWQVRDGQRELYLVDNRPVPIRQAGRQWHEPFATGDGSHLLTASNPGHGVRYWVDGQPLSAKGDVTEEVVTGAGPAWAAVLGQAGRVFVATHLGDFGPFERVTQPVISHTTGGMVWAAKADGVWRIWRDGRPGEPVPTPDPPRFGPQGILTYCQVGDAKHRAMWVNGRIGPWFDSVDEQPTFSDDGRHIAYGATVGQRAVAVLDGKVVARMNRVERLSFAPTGRRLLIRGETGRWNLPWLADAPLPTSSHGTAYQVAWSRDGRHWAYLVGQPGKQAVVHNGRRSEVVHRAFEPAISPDGRHVVVVAVPKGKTQSDLLVDGRWLLVDSEIDSPGVFGPDGAYRRLVVHDGHTALIEIRWRR